MNEDTNSNTTSTEPSDIKSQVLAFRDNAHAENVRKLKAGIKCIFTVPAAFLILLFLTGSSKIIFLVLWIASLFIIAAYLIHVEYSDYKIQEMVNSLQDSGSDIDGLIDIDSIYTKVSAPKKKLGDIITNVKTDIQTQITAVQNKVAEMAEAVQDDQSVSVQSDEQNETIQTDEHGDSVQTDEHGDSVQTDEQDEATENTEADKEELS
jgi:Skp family chaperone for outer membrane proteins